MNRVDGVFIGSLSFMPSNGEPTGIYKQAVDKPVWLGQDGLTGDVQADRRVHGGPYKALHQYPATNYAVFRTAFPEQEELFVPGSIGENISATDWTEETVCIGDVFRIGAATVQVSQPRTPCWKIDHRFGIDNLKRFVAESGITGWYYRVIEQGYIAPGDALDLIERGTSTVTVRELWVAQQTTNHEPGRLAWLRDLPGLAPNCAKKFADLLASCRN